MPAPTLDGTNTGTATGTTTVAAALTTTGTNRIVCALVEIEHNTTNLYITGVAGGGLTWTKRTQATNFLGQYRCTSLELWWALAPTALSAVSITATANAAFDDAAILVFGVAGCNTINPWDSNQSLAARHNNFGPTVPIFSSISTTQANDFLIFGFGTNYTTSIGTVPTGFTQIGFALNGGGTNYAAVGAAYMGVTATQTNQAFAWGSAFPGTGNHAVIFDALTADTGGSTTAPRPAYEVLNQAIASTTNTISLSVAGISANAVIVILAYCEQSGGGPAISSVSGGGLTWTQRSRSHGSSRGSLEVWSAQVAGTLATSTITVTYPGNFDDLSILAMSVAGCNASVWDANSSLPALLSNTGGATWTPSVSGISTSQAHDMVLAFTGTTGSTASVGSAISAVPTGFTLVNTIINTGGGSSEYSQLSVGIQARATTQSSATIAWGAAIADYNLGPGGEYVVDALTADAAVVGGATQARAMVLA